MSGHGTRPWGDGETNAPLTRLLADAAAGRPNAARDLLPLDYRSLRELAERQMVTERTEHRLRATALVHEAYFRLVGSGDVGWESRALDWRYARAWLLRYIEKNGRAEAEP